MLLLLFGAPKILILFVFKLLELPNNELLLFWKLLLNKFLGDISIPPLFNPIPWLPNVGLVLLLNKLVLLIPTLNNGSFWLLFSFLLLFNKGPALKTFGTLFGVFGFKNGFEFVAKLPAALDEIFDFGSSFVLILLSLSLFPNNEGILLFSEVLLLVKRLIFNFSFSLFSSFISWLGFSSIPNKLTFGLLSFFSSLLLPNKLVLLLINFSLLNKPVPLNKEGLLLSLSSFLSFSVSVIGIFPNKDLLLFSLFSFFSLFGSSSSFIIFNGGNVIFSFFSFLSNNGVCFSSNNFIASPSFSSFFSFSSTSFVSILGVDGSLDKLLLLIISFLGVSGVFSISFSFSFSWLGFVGEPNKVVSLFSSLFNLSILPKRFVDFFSSLFVSFNSFLFSLLFLSFKGIFELNKVFSLILGVFDPNKLPLIFCELLTFSLISPSFLLILSKNDILFSFVSGILLLENILKPNSSLLFIFCWTLLWKEILFYIW